MRAVVSRAGWSGRATALGLAVLLVVGVMSPGRPAGASPARQLAPRQDQSTEPSDDGVIDPVLDAVEVGRTEDVRRAEGRYADAVRTEGDATVRLVDADRARIDTITRSADAAVAVAAAVDEVSAAEAALRRQVGVLADRKEATAVARWQLTVEQETLRSVVSSVFTSKPSDSMDAVGTFDQMTVSQRRQDVRDRTVDVQSGIVEDRDQGWRTARRAVTAQERKVGRADEAFTDRRTALADAIAVRDDLTRLLGEAERDVADRQVDLVTAGEQRWLAFLDRREARLLAPVTGTGLSLVDLHTYWRASAQAPCAIPWWLLAGIGKVESRHGTLQASKVLVSGDTSVRIIGIALDGRPGVAVIGDTDGGALDEDTTWDRAVGPMQFIPSTWRSWGRDGNADTIVNPHNLYDAALAAAHYLCLGRWAVTDEATMRSALFSYNQSVPYGSLVLAEGASYRKALELPDLPPADAADVAPPAT